MIGKTILQYEILEKLGEGGMGVVYKALDTKLDRHVAIKFLPPHLKTDEQAKKRFVYEAKAASALNHANIAVVHDIHETPEGQMFIVMAYYEGQTLKDKVTSGVLDIDESVAIASQIASGLSAAHERGILHRDIKPANVLLGTDGQAKLADFGLAKLTGQTKVTKTGTTVGTVAYMSPEQASGREVDHRSDVFSLGVVLYELLTGKLPFRGDHEAAVLYGIMNSDPEPLAVQIPDLPAGLQRVVERALAKEPGSRYETAADMKAELEATRTGVVVGSNDGHGWPIRRQRAVTLVLVVALIAVAAYTGISRFWQSEKALSTEGKADLVTIAVLPFVNMSSDAEQEYFSDGLTEELINVLVKIPELRVTGRTSSFSFKGKNEDLRAIGQKLNVAHILEGSVRKSDDEIRVTAQLVKVEDGFHLWSETYERTLEDIFAVQDEVAQSVARALNVTLLGTDGSEEHRPRADSTDPEVQDLILRARYAMEADRSEVGVSVAQRALDRALAINPNYAPLWVELYALQLRKERTSANLTPEERDSLRSAQRKSLEKAIALDPELASAHAKLGIVQLWNLEVESATRSVERALRLAPGSPRVTNAARFVYACLGRVDEALSFSEHAVASDPLVVAYRANLAEAYIDAGRFEDALNACNELLNLKPNFWAAYAILGRAYLFLGRLQEARDSWDRWREHLSASSSFHLWSTAIIEQAAGNMTAADAARAEYEIKYAEEEPVSCAVLHAWRGGTDDAFKWLEKASETRDSDLASLKTNHFLTSLHDDPRWKKTLEKVGLPTD